jgi:hypothetical protein
MRWPDDKAALMGELGFSERPVSLPDGFPKSVLGHLADVFVIRGGDSGAPGVQEFVQER